MKAQTHNGFTIPEPCHMDWDKMTKVEGGQRHCSSCNKVLTDFSKMNDEQLLQFISKNGHSCGRFTKQQLDRKLIAYGTVKESFSWKSLFLFPTLFFGIHAPAKIHETHLTTPVNTIPERNNVADEPKTMSDSITFSGKVRDVISSEAIVFAVVKMTTANDTFYTQTDVNGLFNFKLAGGLKGDSAKIEIKNFGYDVYTKEVIIDPVCIVAEMQASEMIYVLGGPMSMSVNTTPTLAQKTKNFVHRIFR